MESNSHILYLDIEASDLSADIGHLLSIGYMWEGENKPTILSLINYPGSKPNDDRFLLKAFEPIFEKADLVVHHFGDYYDLPFIQTRRLINGLLKLSDVQTVDTWKIARKKLRLGSNRLERILDVLNCPYQKTPVRLSIWSDARIGDKKAFKYVEKHNEIDVLVLAWVYKRIRSMWPSHPALICTPHMSLNKCIVCGGKAKRNGIWPTAKHHYQRIRCTNCGKSWKGECLV